MEILRTTSKIFTGDNYLKTYPSWIGSIFMMSVGIFLTYSSFDVIVRVGWVFLFGGEVLLGMDIVNYYYRKSLGKNQCLNS